MAATLKAVAATDNRIINLEKDGCLLKAICFAIMVAMLKITICLCRKTKDVFRFGCILVKLVVTTNYFYQ